MVVQTFSRTILKLVNLLWWVIIPKITDFGYLLLCKRDLLVYCTCAPLPDPLSPLRAHPTRPGLLLRLPRPCPFEPPSRLLCRTTLPNLCARYQDRVLRAPHLAVSPLAPLPPSPSAGDGPTHSLHIPLTTYQPPSPACSPSASVAARPRPTPRADPAAVAATF